MEYRIETKILAALLEFASKDAARPHISGLGITESGYVCCTDGHTLARYRDARDGKLRAHAQRVWPRAYLDEQIAVAKARKLAEVTLHIARFDPDQRYPPADQVIPRERGIEPLVRVGFNPAYFARLAKLNAALGRAQSGVALVSMQGELDPVMFLVGDGDREIDAVIMPARL